jgi:hypothetical protein
MVIRHAEKPDKTTAGVDTSGKSGKDDLTVRGWQRAGALTVLFGPSAAVLSGDRLTTPKFLYASKDGSQRSMQTITPLSSKLGLPISPGSKGAEAELAKQARGCEGPVLISWQRERIPDLAANLLAGTPDASRHPKLWPVECFDVIWIFDLDPQSGAYCFSQMPQQLLPGDSENGITE